MDLPSLAVVVVVALMAGTIMWTARYRQPPRAVPRVVQDAPRTCDGCAGVVSKQLQLEAEFANVKAAVAEGIEHVERVENRIRGTIKRARKELRDGGLESPGLEAEVGSLSLVDGEGGGTPSMPVLSQPVEPARSSVPGVSPEQLRSVRRI